MHVATIKIINAQQARRNNIYKNTKLKNPRTSLHQKQRTHKYMICCHNTHANGIFIILTRDFS
jgi:hypothetical protein